jgi:5'-nucleotidase
MRILITNDDGIHANGLAVLERMARTISEDLWVVAPEVEQSGQSRALTLTAPIRVRRAGEQRFAVSGTPTDCVLLGLHELISGKRPDLVLSGVNRGQNIAEDVTFSGTVAAAMQGMQMGVRSIAFSQAHGFRQGVGIPWQTADAHGPRILKALLARSWAEGVLINVNFPDREPEDVAGVEVTRQGFRDEGIIHADRRTDPRGNAYYWLGFRGTLSDPAEGTDLRAVYDGKISITPLHIDLSHAETIGALSRDLGSFGPA